MFKAREPMTAALDTSRILIAEDQEHVREALAMLLRGKGYAVAHLLFTQ